MTAEAIDEAEPDAAPVSRIVITFKGPGLAECSIEAEGVVEAQVYGAAKFLDMWCGELRFAQLARMDRAQQASSVELLVPNRALRPHPVQ